MSEFLGVLRAGYHMDATYFFVVVIFIFCRFFHNSTLEAENVLPILDQIWKSLEAFLL
jgi:hypothetical protein